MAQIPDFQKQQPRQAGPGAAHIAVIEKSALTRLEAWVGLVDDVNTTLATNNLVVAVALHQSLEGVADLHDIHLIWPALLTCSQFSGVHRDWLIACQQQPGIHLNN
jgi:hypothetical protein